MASRLSITEDRTTALLISLSNSIVLAGDRAFPTSTAKTVLSLSKAVRAALEAQEKKIALALLDDVSTTLEGEKGIYAEAVARKVEQVKKAISFIPKFEEPLEDSASPA